MRDSNGKRRVPTPPPTITERGKRGDVKRAIAIVQKAGTEDPVRAGDEVPEALGKH
jgi:hypothetical protein